MPVPSSFDMFYREVKECALKRPPAPELCTTLAGICIKSPCFLTRVFTFKSKIHLYLHLISDSAVWKRNWECFWTYVSGCSDSPAPPHSVSGSASCGETPEPRFVPFWLEAVLSYSPYTGSSFFSGSVLQRNPLCLHLASRPRLWCFGRGAPHIWNSRKKRGFPCLTSLSAKSLLFDLPIVHLRCSRRVPFTVLL